MRIHVLFLAATLLTACATFVEGPPSDGATQRPPSTPTEPRPGEGTSKGAFAFGTLLTDPDHASDEAAAGAKNAMLELSWADYEPAAGAFDATYVRRMKDVYGRLTSAGMRVTLALGLHEAPDWVFDRPNSRFVDAAGKTSAAPNLVFNEQLRQEAARYFERVNEDFALPSFWAIRLSSGASTEVLYPGEGEYWAFDANAKNGPDMPPTMAKNPFPGWQPGQRTLTRDQVQAWADWYVGALANSVDWQIAKLGALGFQGYYQVLTPGTGVRPTEYADDIARFLPEGLTGLGAVWHKLYAFLPHARNVVAYVTSMGDRSGDDDACEPGDADVALDDPRVRDWSAARWISRIADAYGLEKNGENPGWGLPAELNAHYADRSEHGMLAASVRQMTACHFQGMYWAHSERLWDGTMPFATYARAIADANATP